MIEYRLSGHLYIFPEKVLVEEGTNDSIDEFSAFDGIKVADYKFVHGDQLFDVREVGEVEMAHLLEGYKISGVAVLDHFDAGMTGAICFLRKCHPRKEIMEFCVETQSSPYLQGV